MDVGTVVPVAVATGIGLLLRSAPWARRGSTSSSPVHVPSTSVTALALVLLSRRDPSASPTLTVGSGAFTLTLIALNRPMVHGRAGGHRPQHAACGGRPTDLGTLVPSSGDHVP